MQKDQFWDYEIKPKNKWYEIDLGAIWNYRDLMMLLVKRDFISVYKQTILGPFWFFIQPVLTTLTFVIIFGKIAHIGTDGIPFFLFYLSGITLWSYFADCLNKTSNTFIANANVFGKVYFPRLVVPIAALVSNAVKLSIQLLLFLATWCYFLYEGNSLHPHYGYIILFPLLVLMVAGLGLGFGILISSLTTKYRDFTFLVGFGIQLMMYASPVVYPLSIVPDKYKWIILTNPVSSVIEAFKFIFLGNGFFSWYYLAYSFCFMVVLLFIAIITFSKVEKSFMDTV
jgi:lipopolysaccharide transport system permease protein